MTFTWPWWVLIGNRLYFPSMMPCLKAKGSNVGLPELWDEFERHYWRNDMPDRVERVNELYGRTLMDADLSSGPAEMWAESYWAWPFIYAELKASRTLIAAMCAGEEADQELDRYKAARMANESA